MARGIALSELHRDEDARLAWTKARDETPGDQWALDALDGRTRAARAWLETDEASTRRAHAEKLAECGHFYLDLGLPERSQRCFAAADAIDPQFSAIARLIHQRETDLPAALTGARKLAAASASLRSFSLLGYLELCANKIDEAKVAIDAGLKIEPNDGDVRGFK